MSMWKNKGCRNQVKGDVRSDSTCHAASLLFPFNLLLRTFIILIIIIKELIKRKILSVWTILSAYTRARARTHTRTRTHARTHARTHTSTHAHKHARTHAHKDGGGIYNYRMEVSAVVLVPLLPSWVLLVHSTSFLPSIFNPNVTCNMTCRMSCEAEC